MKLTHHISIRYIGVTSIVMLLTIPVFYFIILFVMMNSVDETLLFQKQWIEKKLKTISPVNFISYNNNIIITSGASAYDKERIFNQDIYIPEDNEIVTHRVLEFTTEANGKLYHIRCQKSLVENEDLLKSIIAMQSGIFIILLTSLLFINRNLNRKVWKPFYKTLNELHNYRVDKQSSLDLLPVKINELNDLNESINELTKRNHQLYIEQKEFTENASHELQTPLAIMQSNIDLFLQTSPITEEQALIIENLTDANQRMNKLNKALLLLAKIENNQFPNKERIYLGEIILKTVSRYEDATQQKNITLFTALDKEAEIYADKTLAEILFGNLISNAIRHTIQNGLIEITLNKNSFKITNTATGKALDAQKLFKRFQKSGTDSHSIGLGLEISQKIGNLYGCQINYSFDSNRHCFTVSF